jgi:hypothetical protein
LMPPPPPPAPPPPPPPPPPLLLRLTSQSPHDSHDVRRICSTYDAYLVELL